LEIHEIILRGKATKVYVETLTWAKVLKDGKDEVIGADGNPVLMDETETIRATIQFEFEGKWYKGFGPGSRESNHRNRSYSTTDGLFEETVENPVLGGDKWAINKKAMLDNPEQAAGYIRASKNADYNKYKTIEDDNELIAALIKDGDAKAANISKTDPKSAFKFGRWMPFFPAFDVAWNEFSGQSFLQHRLSRGYSLTGEASLACVYLDIADQIFKFEHAVEFHNNNWAIKMDITETSLEDLCECILKDAEEQKVFYEKSLSEGTLVTKFPKTNGMGYIVDIIGKVKRAELVLPFEEMKRRNVKNGMDAKIIIATLENDMSVDCEDLESFLRGEPRVGSKRSSSQLE
jgi:hypothetical protein